MPNITFNGLGSGLQVADIVGAIVGAEQVPFETRLNRKEAAMTTDISAVGALKSALQKVQDSIASLADPARYQLREAKGNDDFISISSDKDAEIGDYSVQVDALAQAHKLTSVGFAADETISTGGVSTITIGVGEDSFSTIFSATNTLEEIKDQINDGPFTNGTNNTVSATIITSDDGQHLVLTSKETGLSNAIKITVEDGDGNNTDNVGLSRLAYDPDDASPTFATNMIKVSEAKDAQITIDGTLVVTSSTNKFENVIDGVDITAKKTHNINTDLSVEDLSNISLSENNANIEAGLNQFVKSYNELITLSKQLGQSTEGSSGPLVGDSLLRGVMNQLRQQLSTPFESSSGETLSLSQLGVRSISTITANGTVAADSTLTSGHLSLDKDELDAFIAQDVDGVQNFFLGSDDAPGFATSVDTLMTFYTQSGGVIDSRIQGKKEQLLSLDDERIDFSQKMAALEARLFSQYNAMDLLVANLNATGDYLTAQLDNMPGVVKQNN